MSIDRRRFLTVSAASVVGRVARRVRGEPEAARRSCSRSRSEERGTRARAFSATMRMDSVPASAKLAGKDFPKYYISKKVPVWDPAVRGVWRLEVSGAVRTPLSLSLDDLMKLPHITQKVDHFCVEGWNARAEWTGVRMSDLARVAGMTADAHYVDFQSFDDGLSRELGHGQRDASADAHRLWDGRAPARRRARRAGARAFARSSSATRTRSTSRRSCSCRRRTAATGAIRATSGTAGPDSRQGEQGLLVLLAARRGGWDVGGSHAPPLDLEHRHRAPVGRIRREAALFSVADSNTSQPPLAAVRSSSFASAPESEGSRSRARPTPFRRCRRMPACTPCANL